MTGSPVASPDRDYFIGSRGECGAREVTRSQLEKLLAEPQVSEMVSLLWTFGSLRINTRSSRRWVEQTEDHRCRRLRSLAKGLDVRGGRLRTGMTDMPCQILE